MKKNILYILALIMLLLAILVLAFLIINLSNRAKNTTPPQIVVPEEATPIVDTGFSRYGITPREARYYE